MTKEMAIHNLYALKQRTRASSNHEALEMAIRALEQTSWIPVSERLPEHKGDYLVTFKLLFTYPIEVCYFDGQAWDKGQYDTVLAYMPLPEPYKEG